MGVEVGMRVALRDGGSGVYLNVGIYPVIARAAIEDVAFGAADDDVVAAARINDVAPASGFDEVVPSLTGIDDVVARAADDVVIGSRACQAVGSVLLPSFDGVAIGILQVIVNGYGTVSIGNRGGDGPITGYG